MIDGTHILYMEDDPGLARLLQKRLRRAGYEVDVAPDGEQGLAQYRANHYDVIIIDQRMPGQEGIEVIRTLATEAHSPPMIMVTGTGNEPIAVEAIKLGAADYIVKDPDGGYLELLPSVIEQALYRRKLVRQRRTAEAALRASEARYRLLAENSFDLIGLLDLEGNILYASPSHFRVLGFRPEELQHQNIFQILHADDKATVLDAVTTLLDSQEAVKLEVRLPNKQQEWILVEAILSIVAAPNNNDDDAPHILFSARDITQRKQAEEALNQYAADLQAHNEELDAFSHTVAHDLKTPLSHIVGLSSFMVNVHREMEPDELNENLNSILESGQQMSNIINELLLLASVRKQMVKTRPLQMEQIIEGALRRLAYVIDQSQARIGMSEIPEPWPEALGYGPWVEEVWINYISNGLKYGGHPPCLELGATPQADGTVRFWVRDDGPGLTSEQQKRLFIPFNRLSQVRAEGHGLGLSIVRRIVEKLGGQVGVDSTPGQGSVFLFTLPGVAE